MRSAWVTGAAALNERMRNPAQLEAPVPQAEMPPYMEMFLAHLRLLIGVPFDYLIADSRLLPEESIRFFYLDRSWTDRLVDGAISVGEIGTREQAHHQAHGPVVQQQLDMTENVVRILQRGLTDFPGAKLQLSDGLPPADIITGFLLRSAAVSGWPHMDVRAFKEHVKENANPAQLDPKIMVPLLRLERLSPSVLLALFQGIPKLVWCEQPHHGVQFGIQETNGVLEIPLRDATGTSIPNNRVPVAMRKSGRRVVAVAQLRKDIIKKGQGGGLPPLPAQTGAAGFAISVLDPPWRQRFEGQGGDAGRGKFNPALAVAATVERPELRLVVKELVR